MLNYDKKCSHLHMTRQESQVIKGIALLMMLWLHLFSNAELASHCQNLFVIDNIPLATMLTRACPPVGFFVFCGGYGLYYTYRKGNDPNYFVRIVKLFVTYWFILLVLIPLCIWLSDAKFPMDIKSIGMNVSGLHCSWNAPCWFLLPYSLLSLSYPALFKLYENVRVRFLLPATLLLSIAMMALLHFWGTSYINDNPILSVPICYLGFLFMFFCGSSFLRCDILTKIRHCTKPMGRICSLVQVTFFLLLVGVVIWMNTAVADPLYTLGIIICALAVPLNPKGLITRFFENVGRQSMNMWMLHYFIYVYLLHDFIYGLKYPLVIFVALLSISYIGSMLINKLLSPVLKVIRF